LPGKKPKARNKIFITSEAATRGCEVSKKIKRRGEKKKESLQEKEHVKGDGSRVQAGAAGKESGGKRELGARPWLLGSWGAGVR